MRNFRTYDLAVQFYRSAQKLKLGRTLREQLDRAASSIALILAEGRGRSTVKDQVRFFHIAFGSVRECQSILDLAGLKDTPAFIELDCLAAALFSLIRNAK